MSDVSEEIDIDDQSAFSDQHIFDIGESDSSLRCASLLVFKQGYNSTLIIFYC